METGGIQRGNGACDWTTPRIPHAPDTLGYSTCDRGNGTGSAHWQDSGEQL